MNNVDGFCELLKQAEVDGKYEYCLMEPDRWVYRMYCSSTELSLANFNSGRLKNITKTEYIPLDHTDIFPNMVFSFFGDDHSCFFTALNVTKIGIFLPDMCNSFSIVTYSQLEHMYQYCVPKYVHDPSDSRQMSYDWKTCCKEKK